MTLEARGVSVRIGRARLLDDVALAVQPGEVVAVAGPNGAGKSTLVGLLAGDRQPSTGSVTLDGREVAAWPRDELARRRAVMSADGSVAFAFTAEEVVLLGRLPWHGGSPGPADRAIARELLAAVDAAHLGDRAVATLSSGERQRVQLARAIAQVTEPDDGVRYLLLDEPTTSLDPAHQHTAMRLVGQVAADGHGVLVVLHDLNLAAAYADRIILMQAGRVAADGTPDAVLEEGLLESVFAIPMRVIDHPVTSRRLVIPAPAEDK